MNTQTDLDLVSDCLNGLTKSQYILYNRFAANMLSTCKRYIKSIDEAEDILQDGFIKVFKNLDQFTGTGSLEGWIRTIMVNTALNAVRRKEKEKFNIDIDSVYVGIPDTRPTKLDNLDANIIYKLIESLPIGYKTVFNAYEIDGLHHYEIAKMLGVSVNTSKSQLIKARRVLQTKINLLTSSENKKMKLCV